MKKKFRWKIVLVLAVVVLSAFLAYPPGTKIKRGLDLEGGMHLVLQVVTDDAISNETNQEILRLQDQMKRKDISYDSIIKSEERIGRISLKGFDPAKEREARDLLDEYFGEWDSTFSGNNATLTMKANATTYFRDQAVKQSIETIRNRVDELGLSEIPIQRQGGLQGERIIVELPGIEDPERVKNILKTTAQLEWRMVEAGPAANQEALLTEYEGKVPENMEVLPGDPRRNLGGNYYLVNRVAAVSGKDLRDARRSQDEWNNPAVSFRLSPEAGRRFYKFTSDNLNRLLSVILDGKVITAATIEDRISDSGIIRGQFTVEAVEDLTVALRAGALPASIKYLEERTIGPSLGADSIRKGLTSIIIALVLILIFMVVYYRLAGVNAVSALILNILILAGALAYFKAHLTLPGIAGIILTIGMAVDANVLVFERIREELSQGKSVLSAIASGFSRAFKTILDANVTTIIAAVFLFQFGTGPVRGFAVTLIIGITASMFTAVFVSRLIFDVTVSKKRKREKLSI
ncbi:MAG: protein translocase subunit SecD [Candidatus Aminicenantes bacterium]|nr:protein translocase subunit SecD [Candidatus Aminicenantes bacterium]